MAFDSGRFTEFHGLLHQVRIACPEERSVAENFILEERLTDAREHSYGSYIPQAPDEWEGSHRQYLAANIHLVGRGVPETFTDLNSVNLLPDLDEDQYLVRLENLDTLNNLAMDEDTVQTRMDHLGQYLDDRDSESVVEVETFLEKCNLHRDHRPVFAGFWGEVSDILSQDDVQWANRLRDRFGLGHLDPLNGKPIPILLLRYRLREVIEQQSDDFSIAAIPTVLDGARSPFFCPVPLDGWNQGQVLDLSPGTENEYAITCEILHRFIEYRPSHVYRVGWITESPGKSCEEARRIHYLYLENDFRNFHEIHQ